MQIVRSIANNTLFQIISRLASSSTGFFIALLIARHFGVSGYGEYAKVTAFVGLFYLFVDFGLNAVFLHADKPARFIKELLFTRLLFAAVLVVVVCGISFLLPFHSESQIGFSSVARMGILLFSLTLFSEAIVYSMSALFQLELSYQKLMLASVVGSLTTFVLVVVTVVFSFPLMMVFGSFVIGGVVKSFFSLSFSKQRISHQVSMPFVRKLLASSLPVALMLVCNLIYFRIDMLLLSLLSSTTDVAVYDFSYKFFDFLIALPLFISNTLYPRLIQQAKNQKHIAIFGYVGLFGLLSLVVVIPVFILAPFLSIVKPEFGASGTTLRILALGLPLFFMTSILQWILLARKQQRFLAVVYALAAVVNIGLNLVFIPRYSYIAASVITGVSELFVFIALMVWSVRIKK